MSWSSDRYYEAVCELKERLYGALEEAAGEAYDAQPVGDKYVEGRVAGLQEAIRIACDLELM